MSKKRFFCLSAAVLATLSLIVSFFFLTRKNTDQRFEHYTRELFCQEVASNTITLHYTLKNPEEYGISEGPASYGSVSTDTASMGAAAENALASLHLYDRQKLSRKNKLTYDILEETFAFSVDAAKYALYEEPLAPLTGTQSQLPVLLSEYPFYDTSDVDTYLELLSETPDYFYEIAEFEKAKSDAGLFMAAYSADAIIEECQTFIQMGTDNYLYSSFEERIQKMDISKEQQEQYILANQKQIEEAVFPAYEGIIATLQKLRSTGQNLCGLCYLPDGKEYYELLVASETGSARSIPELQKLTESQMKDDLAAMQQVFSELSGTNALADDSSTENETASSAFSDIFQSQGTLLSDTNPAAILENLKSCMKNDFPEPPDVNTNIKYVQESMEEYLSPAFYMIPAIDNTKNNVIYINQGHMPDDL